MFDSAKLLFVSGYGVRVKETNGYSKLHSWGNVLPSWKVGCFPSCQLPKLRVDF